VLVNNAGITRDGTVHRMTPTKWEEVTNTNLGSCFNMSHCAISGMQERKFGWIVNVASINGQADSMGRSITQREARHPRFHESFGAGRCWHGRHGDRGRAGICGHGHGAVRTAKHSGKN